MIPASSARGPTRHTEAPAPVSLLLDIPRDVVPNIFTRLPGPALLQLAQVCKQIPMDDKRDMLKQWVGRELADIGALDGQQLWTRFLDLAINCADLVDSAGWQAFTAEAEKRRPGQAMLLGLAMLSHGKGMDRDLAAPGSQPFGAAEKQALLALLTDADKERWMGKAAAAVIAGRWLQVVDQRAQTPGSAPGDTALRETAVLFSTLPLAGQIDVMPFLECGDNDGGQASGVFAGICRIHMYKLAAQVFNPVSGFSLDNASRSYLAKLSSMHRPEHAHEEMKVAKDLLRQILRESLGKGMAIGPWREQAPELALCLFLALAWNPKGWAMDQDLGKQLVDRKFITKRECQAFSEHVAKGKGSYFDTVQRWLALNRGRKAPSSCAVG
jgi:hypothetical protein